MISSTATVDSSHVVFTAYRSNGRGFDDGHSWTARNNPADMSHVLLSLSAWLYTRYYDTNPFCVMAVLC